MSAEKVKDEIVSTNGRDDVLEFTKNAGEMARKCHKILEEFVTNQEAVEKFIKGESNIASASSRSAVDAFSEMLSKMTSSPEKVVESWLGFYSDYTKLVNNSFSRMVGENVPPAYIPEPKDRRFKDDSWNENMVFDFIKQSYLLSSDWVQRTVRDVDGIDSKTARKVEFYTKQFVDAMSPSNFLITNPEVMRETINSNGKNLVTGLENLLEDIEESREIGRPIVRTSDKSIFEVGKDLAATKGKVIFQNDMLQLIQYEPSTTKVHKTPILVISPWINKYYILDMRARNSLVKWLVDQGYTVFITSWVNPSRELANKSFEDYMKDGSLAAIDAIEQATGEKQVNIMGYCLGGTLTACTLAYLAAKNRSDRVKSVTYLTTLVDFEDAGDLSVFVDELQLDEMEKQMKEDGFFSGNDMSYIFSMLRSNDLIWSFAVNNYLMGRNPFPFDLLHWNNDSTRMPAAMHIYYLRNMYKDNNLIKKNKLILCGEKIDLTTIKTPTYILATREDHIAPWRSTYAATHHYKGDIRFVLSGSGHVAGVINPPVAEKYGYWTNDKLPKTPEKWLEGAKEQKGSWWENWDSWILDNKFSGTKINAKKVGSGKLKPIEDAPGSYVKVRGV